MNTRYLLFLSFMIFLGVQAGQQHRAYAQSPCPSDQISIGQTVSGSYEGWCYALATTDAERSDSWYFQGIAGSQLLIEMTRVSGEIDPYLRLGYTFGGELATVEELSVDDDGAGYPNARIIATLPYNATYVIYATSFVAEGYGDYILSLQSFDCRDTTFAIYQGSITSGQQPIQALPPITCAGDRWEFSASAGDVAQISMNRAQFESSIDPYLMLLAPDGQWLAADDDSGGSLNAYLEVTLPSSGVYAIIAAPFDANSNGAYTLSLQVTAGICTAIVNVAELNLRAGPSTAYALIASYVQGDSGEILGYNNAVQGTWWLVRMGDRRIGWLSANPASGEQGTFTVTQGNCSAVPFAQAPLLPTAIPSDTPIPPTALPTFTPLPPSVTATVTPTVTSSVTPSPTLTITPTASTTPLASALPETGGIPAALPTWLPIVVVGIIGVTVVATAGETVRRRAKAHTRETAERLAKDQLELPCKRGQIAYRKRKFTPEFSQLEITKVVIDVLLPNTEHPIWSRELDDAAAEALTDAWMIYRTSQDRDKTAQRLLPIASQLLRDVLAAVAREDGARDVIITAHAEGSGAKVEYTRCRCESKGGVNYWRDLNDWEHEAKDQRKKNIVHLRAIDPRDQAMPARLTDDMVEWLLHFLRRI